MAQPHMPAGPVYDLAEAVLRDRAEFAAFRNGTLSRAHFATFLDAMAPALCRAGLPADDVQFAKRYPSSETRFVDDSLQRLVAAGIIPTTDYDRVAFERAAIAARVQYQHGPFATYIY